MVVNKDNTNNKSNNTDECVDIAVSEASVGTWGEVQDVATCCVKEPKTQDVKSLENKLDVIVTSLRSIYSGIDDTDTKLNNLYNQCVDVYESVKDESLVKQWNEVIEISIPRLREVTSLYKMGSEEYIKEISEHLLRISELTLMTDDINIKYIETKVLKDKLLNTLQNIKFHLGDINVLWITMGMAESLDAIDVLTDKVAGLENILDEYEDVYRLKETWRHVNQTLLPTMRKVIAKDPSDESNYKNMTYVRIQQMYILELLFLTETATLTTAELKDKLNHDLGMEVFTDTSMSL